MKKIINYLTLGIASVTLLVSCNNSNKENTNPKTVIEKEIDLGKIDKSAVSLAYYIQDSITTQFNFYREVDSMLKAKELSFQKELEKKIRAYQVFEADVQKRMDNNEITGYQIEDIQRTAMRKQQEIQEYQEQKGMALQKETFQYTTALMNKIAEAGKQFSDQNGIDLLFFYQKGGQITFINSAYNVTDQFISFLNQREDELKLGFEEEVESLEGEADKEIEGLGGIK